MAARMKKVGKALQKEQLQQLIKDCQQYKRAAQRELYLLFADDLMNLAMRYARDQSMARDLVHDTFLKVFESIPSFKLNKGSFKGWMSRILINKAVEGYRRNRRMIYAETPGLMRELSTENLAIDKLEAEDILQLLQQLPVGSRMIFNMYVIEGFRHDEIAKVMGISSSTSRSQLTRAKQILREKIRTQFLFDRRRGVLRQRS